MRIIPWLWCCVSLLVPCAGCWQEVHYNPNNSHVVLHADDSRSEESLATAQTELASKPPAIIADHLESDEVTADELFGSPAEPVNPTQSSVPADVDSTPALTTKESPTAAAVAESSDDSTPSDVESPGADISVSPLEEPDVIGEETSTRGEILRPSRTALAVWQMSSRWSFAAAVYAKGQPEERYRDSLDQATYAAELVGLALPSFPASEGMTLEAAVITYLLGAGPEAFVKQLGKDYLPEYEALAELAIRTNALLLVYTPKSQQLDPLISSIRRAAQNSGLPEELWADLVSMLERREPFADVKHRVLSFHTEVGDYLAGQE